MKHRRSFPWIWLVNAVLILALVLVYARIIKQCGGLKVLWTPAWERQCVAPGTHSPKATRGT